MSTRKSVSWKEIGQFLALLVALFTLTSKVLKKAKVGPEIIEWLMGSGKDFFSQKLTELGTEFLRQTTLILQAEIDTNIDPRLPLKGVTIEKHHRQGKVVIVKRVDGLYVNGQKVILYRSSRQLHGKTIVSYKLRTELGGQTVQSASILDFLFANSQYIPEEWKERDENGNIVYVYFWDTIYRDADGNNFVRYLCWDDSQWYEGCGWLGGRWNSNDFAAVLEGN